MAVKQWSVGDVLAAADMNVWTVPVAVIKPGNTSRASNTTATPDPDLVLPVAASTTYDIRMLVLFDGSTTGTGDIKWTFTVPASASGSYVAAHQNLSGSYAGAFSNNWTDGPGLTTTQANANGVGVIFGIFFNGILTTSATAGNLTFSWAQNTSSSTATRVYANSYMVAQRIS